MRDRITANLPARRFDDTAAFYARLGFTPRFKHDGWMILDRGELELEFFPYPDLEPGDSSFSACVRVSDLDGLHRAWSAAGLPEQGVPRLTSPRLEPFGLRMFALVDLDGSLLRCLENRDA